MCLYFSYKICYKFSTKEVFLLLFQVCVCVCVCKVCSLFLAVTMCCTCPPLGVQSCHWKQSNWVWQCIELLKLLRNVLRSKWRLLCVCVVSDILAMGGSGCVGAWIQCAAVNCGFFVFPVLSDDTHFHSVPFRLKFLWFELIVLATANCPST